MNSSTDKIPSIDIEKIFSDMVPVDEKNQTEAIRMEVEWSKTKDEFFGMDKDHPIEYEAKETIVAKMKQVKGSQKGNGK